MLEFKQEALPLYGGRVEYQFESKPSPLQIGGMFYGVRKGSRVSCGYWIGLHCSVALLLCESSSQVSSGYP